MVGIDLYVNETLAHCDYVLPAATMYERDDFPLPFQTLQPTPFRQATEAVVAPVGQARAEWEIIDDLTRGCGGAHRGSLLAAVRKTLSLFGVRLTPRLLVDAVIRLGEGGDRFGLRRGGLTFSRLAADHPHGTVLAPQPARRRAARHRRLPRRHGCGCGTTRSPPRSTRCRAAHVPTAIRCG